MISQTGQRNLDRGRTNLILILPEKSGVCLCWWLGEEHFFAHTIDVPMNAFGPDPSYGDMWALRIISLNSE